MTRPRLALGLSGGGDSTALLLALRAAYPDVELVALIVDHRLRPHSAREAEAAACAADAAGARPRILTWDAPRPGQARARAARHRLLAGAARAEGASVLCLGHTVEDRVETLRMRAARPGPESRMAGPGRLDPAPVWPEGRKLIIARPLLALKRATLRRYLELSGADWVEDPSNEDRAFERIRLRGSPLSPGEAQALVRRSDAAAARRARLHRRALALIEAAARPLSWGGAALDATMFADADVPIALKALETLALATSGARTPPHGDALARLLAALTAGRAASCGGAHLTREALLGRDAGAAGRADGAPAAPALELSPGETGVFDGRWRITARRAATVRAFGARAGGTSAAAPPALRPALAVADAGEAPAILGLDTPAGVEAASLWRDRIDARLLPPEPPTWFDGAKVAAQVRAALAKPARRPNMDTEHGPSPTGAGPGDGRRKEDD